MTDLKKILALEKHLYLGRKAISSRREETRIISQLNHDRFNSRGPNVAVDYYFETLNSGKPMEGIKNAARMVLEHGTLKSWHNEADPGISKPEGYDDRMSWITGLKLFDFNKKKSLESGKVTIAYPLSFFDKTGDRVFPMAQLMMAIASEPVSAFSFYKGAKIIDIRLPEELKKRIPGIRWPHKRVRKYLCIGPDPNRSSEL